MKPEVKSTSSVFLAIISLIIALFMASCTPQTPEPFVKPTNTEVGSAEISNPASQYCLEQGGTLSIVERGDGGQYGICYFEDNRQCEEWALYRGDCPAGGVEVTGYNTQAGQYCAITGGIYSVTGNNDSDQEQGLCTFKDGTVCDVGEYYNGKCSPGQATPLKEAPFVGGGATRLVFDSNRAGSYREIYVMDLDGTDIKQLTNSDADNFAGPWSPDGQRVVYTTFGLTNSNIAVINSDGSGQVTIDSIQDSDEGFPEWSPDGNLIAFTSRRDGNNEIYLMNADGSNPVRLTNEPGDDFAPSWSPDGKQIVFVSDRDQSTGVYDLYIMNANGSGVKRLTADEAIDYSPDWSPDGQQIAFRSHRDGPADIYIIGIDGSGLRNLTNNPADDWSPTWSPDGKYIAFQTNRDGNWEIYVMSVDGTEIWNLTNDPGDDQMPYWSPAMTEDQTTTSASNTEQIPLKDALNSIQPQDVFQNFYEITQVPRKSGSTDKIRKFLVDFGEGLGLDTIVDDAGNVIIRKPATDGFEDTPGIVLQAHMDMVDQQAPGKEFNFDTDPIEAFVSGDFIVTDGTTLGADDGIGIAMIMAVLESTTLKSGPVEGLFTVDEETSMSGANGLEPDVLKGRILVNLDAETEGSFYIGSAGGEHVNFNAEYDQVSAPAGTVSYLVKVQGLQGGHSGVDIDKGRGHATKLLVRLLKEAADIYSINLSSLNGGSVVNAIPRDASAVIFIADTQVEPFINFLKDFEDTIKSELAGTEPDLSVTAEPVPPPTQVMDQEFQNLLLDALYGTPQGVIRMSDAVPGLVETSINLGIVQVQDGQMEIIYFPRSSVDSELDEATQMIASIWELAGYQEEITDSFAAWTPNPNSPILKYVSTSYQDLYGKDPEVVAVHAGLECGAIGGIYPDMDMISIGPTLENVHSPSERLNIPSVGNVMELLITVLQRLAEG